MNPKVDAYLSNARVWQEEMEKLRMICLDCGLTEEFKWNLPCYTFRGKVIVVIQGFKEYCALLFYKGYLLQDPHGVLVKTGENTRVGRQIRFKDVREVNALESVLKEYIFQATEAEKSGLKAVPEENAALHIPEEFQSRLDKMPALETAFDALTPGRQRAYIFYFSQAKQSRTRESRIEKCIPQILSGKGLND